MTTDPQTETYEREARDFFTGFTQGLERELRLSELLEHADGTLYDWRRSHPTDAAEADKLADELGFDIPDTDDYCWQAAEAYHDFLAETAGYGADRFTTVRVTLAGGGPSAWIEFTFDADDDLTGATLNYCDWFRQPVTIQLTDTIPDLAFHRYLRGSVDL